MQLPVINKLANQALNYFDGDNKFNKFLVTFKIKEISNSTLKGFSV